MEFYTKEQITLVSCFNELGWWLGNREVHVIAGTTLPAGCTENIYTPSDANKIGRYDTPTGVWTEHINKTGLPYWSVTGIKGEVSIPDGAIPDGAVIKAPPEYDPDAQAVLFKDGVWEIYTNHLGEKFWDQNQVGHVVTDLYWKCPDDCTLEKPPTIDPGFGLKLNQGNWEVVIDKRGTEYWTQDGEYHIVTALETEPPQGCMTIPPPTEYHRTHDGSAWIVDQSMLSTARRQERDSMLSGDYSPVIEQLTRWIDSAEAHDDLNALDCYKAQRAAWHAWADALCDLPDQPGFPWPNGKVPWPEQPPKPEKYNIETNKEK